jgi:hypothetical protein
MIYFLEHCNRLNLNETVPRIASRNCAASSSCLEVVFPW